MDLDGIFGAVNKRLSGCRLSVSYYPYSELKHTWRRSDGVLVMRISDYMNRAPPDVLEALAWFLLCRADGKDCEDGIAAKYLSYARSRELWLPKKSIYLSRARNLTFVPKGSVRNLSEVFEYVNGCYFNGSLRVPDLAWVRESPKTRLGFYFEPLDLLAANRCLDSARVPRYVLEFVVYHELLHGLIEAKGSPVRRLHHTEEFKRREREFSHFEDAEKWLGRLAR